MTIFYINQSYLSYKDNKKTYYVDTFILGQVTPLLNQPENLDEYTSQENEAKIICAKYDTVTGQFLGLENCLAYSTVRGDFQEQFFDYGYSKENSKILYSTYKMKIPNIFSTTIFNWHRIQHEPGAFSESDFSNSFSFLPSTVDRVEEINKYMGSVNLSAVDKDFNSCKLDFNNPEREGIR